MFFQFLQTSTTGIVQTFGRFSRLAKPGLRFYIPIVQKITPISNRLQQKNITLIVKTKDNVFTDLGINVQYKIYEEDTEKAFFSLDDPEGQMDAFVKNVVRARVPKLKLDELFENPDDLSKAIEERLAPKMKTHGFTIESTLLTNIHPDKFVMESMNKINATERLKIAATNEAEANYIREVKKAEADKDRKRLQGEGISQQRVAIMSGYTDGVSEMAKAFGMDHLAIVNFVLRTQHLDMLENVGRTNNTKTLFLNHLPDSPSASLFNGLQSSKETQ
tara:strand:- start:2841 stop:3668 length:828 start_codon:yes stop_codon:yes gene_type:complete